MRGSGKKFWKSYDTAETFHKISLSSIHPILRPILSRGHPGLLLKNSAEVIQTGEAAGVGNGSYTEGGVCQQLLCLADADVQNVLLGRGIQPGGKKLAQVYLADIDLLGKQGIGQLRLCYMGFDIGKDRGQQVVMRLLFLMQLVQKLIKSAKDFQPVLRKKEQALKGFKVFDVSLGILQRQYRHSITVQSFTLKV